MNHTKACDGHPCPVPPHPDLVARLQREAATRTQVQTTLVTGSERLSAPSGTTPGLNDGTIFPESYFAGEISTKSLSHRMSAAALERAPLRGSIRVAVVLVDFSDKVMNANAKTRFKDLFFSTGRKIPTGSVTEYYSEVSGGLISMTGEVIGPYRMPKTLVEYGHGQSGLGSVFPNIRTLAADALAQARGNINFDPYDNDHNGYVDAFVVVHAGTGAETNRDSNGIWSAKWVLPTEQAVNSVKIYAFLTIPEDAECGVCAHELGHLVFGWPDLYDTDYSSEGIGDWCLMAGGSWGALRGDPAGTTPCHPSAWCKANQGWVSLVPEANNRSLSLSDVKTQQREVHRLWTAGDTTSQEYFLIENRQKTAFDGSLPGSGLLVWHIDDAVANNTNEKHPKVGLVQADGLNQLATATAGRGDDGDPFPGRLNNHSFTFHSNPSSKAYSGLDSSIEITGISSSLPTMTMYITVRAFTTVYAQGQPGNGIGGYDLRSRADLSFSFDATSSGRLDHLVLYRPGTGTCWILQNNSGAFTPIYARGDPGNGVGGYDLRHPNDRGLAFDYSSTGKANHLVFYRPGFGAIFIIARQGNDYIPVYAQGSGGQGIGGYDLRSAADRIFALDYNHSGKLDHLCLYRPGTGTFWILRNDHRSGGSFVPVYAQGDPGQGIGGYDLKSPADRAFAFDYEGSGRQDYIALYRPGTGTFWCLKNRNGTFTAVVSIGSPGTGIGGYDLRSPADKLFAFDWDGSGKQDHVALYRPGTGTFWCLQNHRDGSAAKGGFEAVYAQGDPGKGIGGFDLRSPDDDVFGFDWSRNGKTDDLVLYRRNGTGTIWILNRL